MNWRTRIVASVATSWFAATVVGAVEPVKQKAEAKPVAAASTEKGTDKAREKDNKKKDQKCAVTTSSRIRREPSAGCEHGAAGERTYTAEEIAATGEMDVGAALRKLDPRIQ